jgi:hypothetical protein
MDGDVSSFNSHIPDKKNKVVQAEAALLEPNVDESHEIVDESPFPRNLLTYSGFSPSESGGDSVDWLKRI